MKSILEIDAKICKLDNRHIKATHIKHFSPAISSTHNMGGHSPSWLLQCTVAWHLPLLLQYCGVFRLKYCAHGIEERYCYPECLILCKGRAAAPDIIIFWPDHFIDHSSSQASVAESIDTVANGLTKYYPSSWLIRRMSLRPYLDHCYTKIFS